MRLSFSALAASLICAGSLAFAQAPQIISTSPLQNELHVSPSTDISVVFDIDIAEEGCGFFTFPDGKQGTVGAAMTITLAAGGAGITGKLSILGHYTA